MKELSIEEKARAYDKVLAIAKEQLNGAKVFDYDNEQVAHDIRTTVYNIFPELKESGDERIRKQIISFLKEFEHDHYRCLDFSSWIAWLEKQGEQKYNNTDFSDLRTWKYIVDAVLTEKEGIGQYLDSPVTEEVAKKLQKRFGNIEQMPVDKVEPKFKTGQWIVWQDKCYKVNYNSCGYELVDQNGLSTSLEYGTVDENAHLWNITKDAKDGDVLATKDNRICIFDNTVEEGKHPFAYCGLSIYGFEVYDRTLPFTHLDVYPATKEQRDLLFTKMQEAGYEWNEDKKELIKL